MRYPHPYTCCGFYKMQNHILDPYIFLPLYVSTLKPVLHIHLVSEDARHLNACFHNSILQLFSPSFDIGECKVRIKEDLNQILKLICCQLSFVDGGYKVTQFQSYSQTLSIIAQFLLGRYYLVLFFGHDSVAAPIVIIH